MSSNKKNKDYIGACRTTKTIELVIILLLDLAFFLLLIYGENIRSAIFGNKYLFLLCVLVWVSLIISLIFILIDFSQLKSIVSETVALSHTAFNDLMTGMPNRQSIDLMIKMQDEDIINSSIGCVLIKIDNLFDINSTFGHSSGDTIIKDFSQMLSAVGNSYGFTGRNGGNDFLGIFENCDEVKINNFINELKAQLNTYNKMHSHAPIIIKVSYAINNEDNLSRISDLLSHVYRNIE